MFSEFSERAKDWAVTFLDFVAYFGARFTGPLHALWRELPIGRAGGPCGSCELLMLWQALQGMRSAPSRSSERSCLSPALIYIPCGRASFQ